MPAASIDRHHAASKALGDDVARACEWYWQRRAGTFGLVLDGSGTAAPRFSVGVGCWSVLRRDAGQGWRGAVLADADALPFADAAFCAVLACFPAAGDTTLAAELARVLAPGGTLLVAHRHPCSLWRAGEWPGRWQRALRAAGLQVSAAHRCGAPWPRVGGAAGLPAWLGAAAGGAWIIEAHHVAATPIPLRPAVTAQRAAEHSTLVPGTQRQCA